MTKRKSGLAHCCHHDIHWEFCYDYAERVEYIKNYKPPNEQELRLRLFQLVPDDILPGRVSPEWVARDKAGVARDKAGAACDKAWAAYDKAGVAYDKAGAACDKAWAARNKAGAARDKAGVAYLSKYRAELDAIHDQLFPDCPWDGKTIFSKGR